MRMVSDDLIVYQAAVLADDLRELLQGCAITDEVDLPSWPSVVTIAISGDSPDWNTLEISNRFPDIEVPESTLEEIGNTLGFLTFKGTETVEIVSQGAEELARKASGEVAVLMVAKRKEEGEA